MPLVRDPVFARVLVDHVVRGGTRVSWQVAYLFADPPPWSFQLQVGRAGLDDADWVDVGPPVVDGFSAVDPFRRDAGVTPTVCYRVVLATARGTYASGPEPTYGLLDPHDWLLAAELIRKARLRDRLSSVPGWLLKRRRVGPVAAAPAPPPGPAARVVDPLTGGIIRRKGPAAAATAGTAFAGGYYAPVPFAVDAANPAYFDGLDPGGTGPKADDAGSGRAVLVPPLHTRDVFVARGSGLRFEVGRIAVVAAWRGVPLVGDAALGLIPPDDIIYTIPVGE